MTTIYRLSNDQYAELFDEDSKVELIDGIVYDKMNVGDAHVFAVNRLAELLAPLWGDRVISVQNPIKWLHNEPEPDVAIFRRCVRQTPEFCDLVIEVADSTLHHDRTLKVPAYLSQGLTAWVVNLPEEQIEIYRPGDPVEMVRDAVIFDISISIDQLLLRHGFSHG